MGLGKREMREAIQAKGLAREERKVSETMFVLGYGKETSWAGTEGSRRWKMFIVGDDCKAGKVCWKHTTGEGGTRKRPFIYFITFNPQHNSRKSVPL